MDDGEDDVEWLKKFVVPSNGSIVDDADAAEAALVVKQFVDSFAAEEEDEEEVGG